MGVYLGAGKTVYDYSAMQGPAPDGFHVPLNTERQNIYNIRTALGGGSRDGVNFGIALKLPFVGRRDKSSADVKTQGSAGYYRSSKQSDNNYAYSLYFYSSNINPQKVTNLSDGAPVRCFKDDPVIPISSWTKLYGTSIEAGGIFWSSTDGLISLSSDGQTWVTIADKNLGATTVWNSGDTLSEANCGGYFQWGNNYMFPFTGSVTTSSTQVDASSYGPGNYYSSSTFITVSSTPPYNWSSVQNNNLWGAATGIVPKIIYPELKNAYIGEYVPNFATQGPAPDGFHVPLSSEWTTIDGILRYTFGLGLDRDYTTECLKMPYAGQRQNETSNTEFQGSLGYYRCADGANAYETDEDARPTVYTNAAARGLSIRPFKNAPVTPDSSRTVLYQGIGSAGVYHNSTLGLISISGDGTTRYTIADKNLGATQVWNSGDTLSEANCGGYYQCGNNYMFPFTGSVTTSSTQVDASSYGPGNYYSSSTFIIGSLRDSSGNGNLRGGVDGNVPVD